MAKKKQNPDLEKLMALFKYVGPFYQEQKDFIWEMAKKYIDPNHPKPIDSCNCALSYPSVFNKLRDYVSQNEI